MRQSLLAITVFIALGLAAVTADAKGIRVCGSDRYRDMDLAQLLDAVLTKLYVDVVAGTEVAAVKKKMVVPVPATEETATRLVYEFSKKKNTRDKKDWRIVFVVKDGEVTSKHISYTGYVYPEEQKKETHNKALDATAL